MLRSLTIENVAVIESAEIEFGSGFNVLTGETGAGKSIVIDSLEAALGWRTSAQIVRSGAKSAKVTAVFTAEGCGDWCRENDIEPSDGELILTRRISEDGRSTCRVNGEPVAAAQVRELGLRLIDIHGQGDGQRLTDERCHRDYLDSFGVSAGVLGEYKRAWSEYSAVKKELESLNLDEAEKARRTDMLTYQIQELERADIKDGEYEEKNARRTLLKNAGKLSSSLTEAKCALLGSDRSDGALSLIESALGSLERAAKLSDSFSGAAAKVRELRFACEDTALEVRDAAEELEFEPEELDELDERLDTLKRVLRKYGGDEKSALEFLENAREELKSIEYADERREELTGKLEKLEKNARNAADKLTAERRAAGERLSKRIEEELAALSMRGARFSVSLGSGGGLTPTGQDDVRFLMSANAGEGFGRIAKVASGGELSRVMLAMKSVLSERDPTDSMVFDEIDTGVSGIAAQRVAEKLARVGRRHQVICVTHLPQLAAMADTHFSISKEIEDGRTFTRVTRLGEEGRAAELARLTGGDNVTDTTIMAAKEQLRAAEAFKSEFDK